MLRDEGFVAQVLGVSRYMVARWADGKTEPVATFPIRTLGYTDLKLHPTVS